VITTSYVTRIKTNKATLFLNCTLQTYIKHYFTIVLQFKQTRIDICFNLERHLILLSAFPL